jgi:hypothetical protein
MRPLTNRPTRRFAAGSAATRHHRKRAILLCGRRTGGDRCPERSRGLRIFENRAGSYGRGRSFSRARLRGNLRILHGRWFGFGSRVPSPDRLSQRGLRAPWSGSRADHRVGRHAAPSALDRQGRALHMFVAAEKVTAEQALEMGLIDAIVPDPLSEAIRQIARRPH